MESINQYNTFNLEKLQDIENFIFDMDGTLTPTKSVMTEEVAIFIRQLLASGKTVSVISGSRYSVVKDHFLNAMSITEAEAELVYLLPTSGAQMFVYKDGEWSCVHDKSFTKQEKQKIIKAFDILLEKYASIMPEVVYGERVEDRESQITMSALGNSTDAPRDEKEAWDPDHVKRQILSAGLNELIPEFKIQIGGSTSLDVTKPGIDKEYGINELISFTQFDKTRTLFVGDAIFEGGTDYPATRTGVHILPVKDHHDLLLKLNI